MHEHIGIPSDRTCEMCVKREIEEVVGVLNFGEVSSHNILCRLYTSEKFLYNIFVNFCVVELFQFVKTFLNCSWGGKVHLNTYSLAVIFKRLESVSVFRGELISDDCLVLAVLDDEFSDKLVGEKHVFFNEVLGVHSLLFFKTDGVHVFIKLEIVLGIIKSQRPILNSLISPSLCNFIQFKAISHHVPKLMSLWMILLLNLPKFRDLLIKYILHKLIIPLSAALYNRSMNPGLIVNNVSVFLHPEKAGVGQSLNIWVQRAEILTEQSREHGDDPMGEVNRRASVLGFLVKCGSLN